MSGIAAVHGCDRRMEKAPAGEPTGAPGRRSIVGWKQGRNGSAIAVLDEPEGFRLRRVREDLQVVEAVVFFREALQNGKAGKDRVGVSFKGGRRCQERFASSGGKKQSERGSSNAISWGLRVGWVMVRREDIEGCKPMAVHRSEPAVRAELSARRTGIEFVADALEWSDTAVAVWVVVGRQGLARAKGIDYHVKALGLVFQHVHKEGGEWRIKLFLSLPMVENVQWPCGVGEGIGVLLVEAGFS